MSTVELEKLKEKILAVSDGFYQLREKETLKQIPELLNELSRFATMIEDEKKQVYMNVLTNAMDALEAKEYILLADILYFDVIEVIGN